MIQIEKELTIAKPIDHVWGIMYGDFANIGQWATGIYHSRPGTEEEGLDRVCDTFTGKLYEKFNFVDEENYTYEVSATGLPGFVTSTVGKWHFEPVDENSTKANFVFTIGTKGVMGKIMEVPMRSRLKKGVDSTFADIISYIENGEISEAKRKELEKQK